LFYGEISVFFLKEEITCPTGNILSHQLNPRKSTDYHELAGKPQYMKEIMNLGEL
jgi:hypothetical protein